MQRILHVARSLHRGGIAIWLTQLLRHIDPARYQMDFLLTGAAPHIDIEAYVKLCPHYRYPWRFARAFATIMRGRGPYNAVHSHVNYYDGFVLMLASRHEVPVRIAHSHSNHRLKEPARPFLLRFCRRPYIGLAKHWIRRYATDGLAVSPGAADALFGPNWATDARFRVLPLGIDLTPFSRVYDRPEIRASLGISPDALIVGHVGNYSWHKNHGFLLDIGLEILGREPRAWLILVGHGLAGSDIETRVQASAFADRILVMGPRNDVARLMLGAMDVFLFPSHTEGLGLVLLEAQAAGLPCVLTDSLPREVDVVPQLIHRLPLQTSPGTWASITLELVRQKRPMTHRSALAHLEASHFNIAKSVHQLTRVYDRVRAERTASSSLNRVPDAD